MGWASPLRVATGGDANCSSEAHRRRSPAHANRRRDCVILPMNVGPSVKLIEGQNLFPSNCLKGIATFPVDLRVQAHFSGCSILDVQGWINPFQNNKKERLFKKVWIGCCTRDECELVPGNPLMLLVHCDVQSARNPIRQSQCFTQPLKRVWSGEKKCASARMATGALRMVARSL